MYSTHMHTNTHLYVCIYVLYVIIFSSVFIANHVKRKNVNVNTTRQTTKLTQLSPKNNNNKSTLHFHFPRGSECVKSLQRRIESHSRIRLFSQFAQRTINKSNNVWRRNVCRSQCRNLENKEADQKLGNGTWVSKPKKNIHTRTSHIQMYITLLSMQWKLYCFVPLTRIFRLWGYIRNEIVLWEKGGRLAARRRRCQREWVFLLTTLLLPLLLLVLPIN